MVESWRVAPCNEKNDVSTGMTTRSAAISALNVSSPIEGGQSTKHAS